MGVVDRVVGVKRITLGFDELGLLEDGLLVVESGVVVELVVLAVDVDVDDRVVEDVDVDVCVELDPTVTTRVDEPLATRNGQTPLVQQAHGDTTYWSETIS
jgi:hypothetical protein